jgi:low temperature requirement protein LtrA
MTPWHPEHIAERYGEFTLIVLGESVLSTMVAAKARDLSWDSVSGGVGAMLLLFGVWWIYFDPPGGGEVVVSPQNSWLWGYGHLPIFAAVAGLGAGLAVAAEALEHQGELSDVGAAFAVAIPVAVYLVVLTELHERVTDGFSLRVRSLVKAVGILAVAALAGWLSLPVTILLMGLCFSASLADNAFAGDRGVRRARSA